MIVYVSIGNSDDKLTQQEWSRYATEVEAFLHEESVVFHGRWFSESKSPWQNACWCLVVPDGEALRVQRWLQKFAEAYRQDSISWAEVGVQKFLTPEQSIA